MWLFTRVDLSRLCLLGGVLGGVGRYGTGV
jgi:hypothetical protein